MRDECLFLIRTGIWFSAKNIAVATALSCHPEHSKGSTIYSFSLTVSHKHFYLSSRALTLDLPVISDVTVFSAIGNTLFPLFVSIQKVEQKAQGCHNRSAYAALPTQAIVFVLDLVNLLVSLCSVSISW